MKKFNEAWTINGHVQTECLYRAPKQHRNPYKNYATEDKTLTRKEKKKKSPTNVARLTPTKSEAVTRIKLPLLGRQAQLWVPTLEEDFVQALRLVALQQEPEG